MPREQPASLIHAAEFVEVVGAENICENLQAAIRRAGEVRDQMEAAAIALKRQHVRAHRDFRAVCSAPRAPIFRAPSAFVPSRFRTIHSKPLRI